MDYVMEDNDQINVMQFWIELICIFYDTEE